MYLGVGGIDGAVLKMTTLQGANTNGNYDYTPT